MKYHLNSTVDYHKNGLDTLGWELTVCNSLEPTASRCRSILERPSSYGNLLYDFLNNLIPFREIHNILEIGGGYGYIMRDFLIRNPGLRATMLDISPYLLGRQRETLASFPADYRQEDFLDTDPDFVRNFDMAVLNENLGRFPDPYHNLKGISFTRNLAGSSAAQENKAGLPEIYTGNT